MIQFPWSFYFFKTQRGDNAIKKWLKTERITKEQIAAFQERIDSFESGGPDLVPGFITETPIAKGIHKVKVKAARAGWVQLRPLGSYGPFGKQEFTLLHGWIERNNAKVPTEDKEKAQENLSALKADRTRRVSESLKE